MDLYYNLTSQYRITGDGAREPAKPLLRYQEQPVWTLYLRDDRNDPVDVSGCASFRAAVDVDLDAGTEVMCRTLNANISHAQASDGIISIRIDTATEQFLAKTNNQKRLPAYFEVWGYDTSGVAVLYVRIDIECSAVVDPEGGDPPSPVEADSIVRKTDLEAVVARELIFEYSPDKTTAHSGLQTGDKYQRIRHGANGVPSAWQLIPYGPQGAGTPGQAASVAIGTVSALEPGAAPTVDNSGTESAAVLNFGIPAGQAGADGKDLDWDAVGELEELSFYDDKPAGFRFAATVIDYTAHKSTLYVYKKASDAKADWLDPIIIVKWSEKGKNADLIEPVEFTAPPDGSSRELTLNMSKNFAATIAAVCIDTDDGEYRLPYANARGILSIYTDRKSNTAKIRFGSQVPEFKTGRIYFAQGLTTLTTDGGSTVWDSAMWYGYITAEVAGNITGVTQITAEMLAAAKAAGTVTQAETASAIGKVTLANVPAYSWVAALLPSGLKATKDDGLGGKAAFAADNGAANSGANGTELTLGEVKLNVYGELQIVTAQTTIYIEEA